MCLLRLVERNLARLRKYQDPETSAILQISQAKTAHDLAVPVLSLAVLRGQVPPIPAFTRIWGEAYNLIRKALECGWDVPATPVADPASWPTLPPSKSVTGGDPDADLGYAGSFPWDARNGLSDRAKRDVQPWRDRNGLRHVGTRLVRDRKYHRIFGAI